MHNLIRNLILTTTTTLALTSAAALCACSDDQAFDEPAPQASDAVITPASLGMGDNWQELEPGLWTRGDAEGEQQFAGIGEAGRLHAIASLEQVEEGLQEILASEERVETRQQLEDLNVYITELRTSEAPMAAEVSPRCTPTLSATVDASPSTCGVSANAKASYSHCSNSGTVRSYASATCGYEAKSHSCGPKPGSPVSCSSTASIIGPGPCKSYASAQINAPGVYVYVWDENLTRGACSGPGGTASMGDLCGGPCSPGKDCHCGDICRAVNTICP